MKKISLQSRIFIIAMLPVVVLSLIIGVYLIQQRETDLETAFRQRDQMLGRQLAAAASFGVFAGNTQTLNSIAHAALQERSVVGVQILNSSGVILASAGELSDVAKSVARQGNGGFFLGHDAHQILAEPVRSPDVALDDIVGGELAPAVTDHKAHGGMVVLEVSTHELRQEALRFKATVVLLLGASLLVAWGVTRLLVRRVSRPIIDIAGAVERIGRGEVGVRVEENGVIEVLNLLGQGLNQMAERLERSRLDLEERIAEATRQFKEKKEEAERSNAAKSRFLAAASHDLRQPMHALGMFVETLVHRKHESGTMLLINQIRRAVDAMGDLLDALLDISRLDAGVIEPRETVFALQPLLDHLSDDYTEACRAKGIEFDVWRTDVLVRSDQVLLARILNNLLSNALRYTKSGRIFVAVRRSGSEHIRIEVRDSGIGIPRESQEAIFQEFVQLGNIERDRSKGLGLGLAIVKRLANLLHHRLSVRSLPDRGSTFGLTIPIAEAKDVTEPVRSLAPASEELSFDGTKVLVIDDDPLARHGLGALMGSWGCLIRMEIGDIDLPARLAKTGFIPTMVISDLRLVGGLSGLDLIARLRSELGGEIPAIVITGDTDPATLRSVTDAGLPVLQKPVRPAQLRVLVRNLLRVGASAMRD